MRKYANFDEPARARNLVLQGVRAVDPERNLDQVLDLHVREGLLSVAPKEIPADADVLDLRGHKIGRAHV